MICKIVVVLMLIIIVACASAGGGDLYDKAGHLEFWYNFYFDPVSIIRRNDSLDAIGTQVLPSGAESFPARFPVNLSPIGFRYVNGEPYVDAFIRYHGDGSDLEAIGVLYFSLVGKFATAGFPLEILPHLVELTTVERISHGGGIADDPMVISRFGLAGESPVKKKPAEPGGIRIQIDKAADDPCIRLWLLRFPKLTHVELRNRVQRAVNHDKVILTIDELPVANYHLMVIPIDSGLCAQSLINIAICADSCTSVDISFARRESPTSTATKFGVWRRDEGNVRPCDE